MKKVIIRIDDVGQCVPGKKPDLGMKWYAPFHEEFRKRYLPYCPCIIPAICDEEMIRWMFRNFHKETVPCLHGWDHIPTANPDSEFEGVSFEGKTSKVEMGMEKLACLWPRGMSAPWNRYNDDVILACSTSGLDFFFGGYGREKKEEYGQLYGIPFFPASESLYVRADSPLETTLKAIKDMPDLDHPQVLTLHTIWKPLEPWSVFLPEIFDALEGMVVSPLDYVTKL